MHTSIMSDVQGVSRREVWLARQLWQELCAGEPEHVAGHRGGEEHLQVFDLPTSTLSHLWRSTTQRLRCQRFGKCAGHPTTCALQRLQQPTMLQARLHDLHQVSQRAVYQGGKCKDQMIPLPARLQPSSMDEKLRYCCKNCRYPPCSVCHKPMPSGKLRQRFDKSGDMDWTCADCLTLQISRQDDDEHKRSRGGAEETLTCNRCGAIA